MATSILDEVAQIKSVMMAVATGKAQINDVEADYMARRSNLAVRLAGAKIQNPNRFASLWDWFSFWKAEGMTSYQQRRSFVNKLYAPVIDILESEPARNVGVPETFSERHGYAPAVVPAEITIREDAPIALQRVIADVAAERGLDYDALFDIAAEINHKPWEGAEPRLSGMSSRAQLNSLMKAWPWYAVYDFIEAIATRLRERGSEEDFAAALNAYFEHAGIGWQLADGEIVTRGSEAFEATMHAALPALEAAKLSTSKGELHKALVDLSQRPHPDLTGAIQHAMAALECSARAASGDRATLGDLIRRHPGLIPKPLDAAVEKAWGYASEMGRHLQEGRTPERGETELIVGIAATIATYLAKKGGAP